MKWYEQQPPKKGKKIIFRIFLAIAIFFVVVIVFISPISKYLIQKYDTKYLGREIAVDWAYVNPFTGYIHLSHLKIYENKNDTVFFETNGLSIDIAMFKLLSKTYEISALKLNKPKGIIIRQKNVFNFNDLIQRFSSKDTTALKLPKDPIHFNILNCEIIDGEFYFTEPNTPINYSFLKVNFNTDGKYWDRDTIIGKLSLQSGIGSGDLHADFYFNVNTLDYRFGAVVANFNLGVMNQYLKALASYGSISGHLNADLKVKGNLNSKQEIDGNGRIEISDYHFGKDSLNDYLSFKKLTLAIIQMAPSHKKYFFDSVKVDEPYFKYEKYDNLDNFQNLFGKNGSKIQEVKDDPNKYNLIVTLSQYIQTLFKNFFKSDYKINSLAVVDANFIFNDYSINEKFSASLNPLNIRSDSINNKNKLVNIYLNSGIKPYGNLLVSFTIDPRTNKDFSLNYKVQKVPAALFNPYIISTTSFPLDRGKLELFGNWQVKNDLIQSNNHLIIIDPRIARKIKKKDARWLPIPLIMFFVRERANVIDYEIPITGNLKDVKFHFKDPIYDAIENFFVKPPTTPYRYEVKFLESEIEKSESLVWVTKQNKLDDEQFNFLNRIAHFLKENPDAKILVQPITFGDKEKEYILFYEAKKKYFLSGKNANQKFISEADSLAIERMSSKDTLFVKYLNKVITDPMLFTVQDKCYRLVGVDLVNKEFNKLKSARIHDLLAIFKVNGTYNQVKVLKNINAIPFNGFSYFRINYNGDIPETILKAYHLLNTYNSEAPRDRYKVFRRKTLK